ncbi:MAG: TonB family protein [Bacteroidetes bacterium]|nr:TonB family protein [Bacteroidota bacterium]
MKNLIPKSKKITRISCINTLLFLSWVILKAQGQFGKEQDEVILCPIEVQAYFPGCEKIVDKSEKHRCAESSMLEFLYCNLNYPIDALSNCIQGTVYVRFTIEKDGKLSDHQILRDIGGGCGNEALRVVKLMPDFEPATQNGRPVRSVFNLPVKFKLE